MFLAESNGCVKQALLRWGLFHIWISVFCIQICIPLIPSQTDETEDCHDIQVHIFFLNLIRKIKFIYSGFITHKEKYFKSCFSDLGDYGLHHMIEYHCLWNVTVLYKAIKKWKKELIQKWQPSEKYVHLCIQCGAAGVLCPGCFDSSL